MPRSQGQRLRKAEKQELAEKALAMSVKGKTVTAISQELDVNWKTASSLIDCALAKRDIIRDVERERSIGHHREIIRFCWEKLEDEELMAHAQNRPAYIARIQASQEEIDRLNDVTPPLRTEHREDVNLNYRDYTRETDYGSLFADLEAYLDGQDEIASRSESMDTDNT